MKEKISHNQLFFLFANFIVGTVIFNPVASEGRDAWIPVISGWMLGFLLVSFYMRIYRLYPEKTLIEIIFYCFGKKIGTIISLLYAWYFIILGASIFRNIGEYTTISIYPETPMIFILMIFGILVIYIVRSGIEVLARLQEIYMPIVILIAIFLNATLLRYTNIENILPVMEYGFKPVVKSTFTVLTLPFGETIIFFMFFPNVADKKKLPRTVYFAYFTGGLIVSMSIIRNLLILGPYMFKNNITLSGTVLKYISDFNIEPLVDLVLLVATGCKVTCCIYAVSKILTQTFGIDDYKFIVAPVVTIMVPLSIWLFKDVFSFVDWLSVYPYHAMIFQIVFPVLIYILSIIKKLKISNT